MSQNSLHSHMIEINRRPHNTAIIFIHGISDCWFSWKDYLRLVDQEGWHGIAVDYDPASALELQLEQLRSIVSGLGDKTIFLMGNDWGGMLAARIASERPEIFAGLVLVNPFVYNLPLPPGDEFQNVLSSFRTFNQQDQQTYRKLLGRRHALPKVVDNFMATVNVPTLFLWGEDDVSTARQKLRHLQKFFPQGICLRFYPYSSRYPHLENFTETANELKYFFSIHRYKSPSAAASA